MPIQRIFEINCARKGKFQASDGVFSFGVVFWHKFCSVDTYRIMFCPRIFILLAIVGSELLAAEPNPFLLSAVLARDESAEAAEAVLAQKTFHPKETFSWHLEIAGRLMQTAFLAQESGDMASARRLATRALSHLAKVEQGLPTDAALAINALELRAVIVERFTGTTTEADELKVEARQRVERAADRTAAEKISKPETTDKQGTSERAAEGAL